MLATDPLQEMLDHLVERQPEVRVAQAPAEQIPAATRSVDTVVAAQAFHWFDADRALAEAARMLKTEGRIALCWNVRDERIPWVRRLGAIIGNNGKEIRLTGPLKYGQITMKRGMTSTFDLWKWFELMLTKHDLRADAEVVLFAADGSTETARFILSRCVPVKLKSPPLSAKDGAVAIEELQLAYETLTLKKPKG